MTFSIGNFLNYPTLTFYFSDLRFLNCDLEFDFYLMRPMITRCVPVETETTSKKPEQIIIYSQNRFIQHEGHQIEICRL